MTIGTQDAWALLANRDKGGNIPTSWTNEDWSKDREQISFVGCEGNGLVIVAPALEPGKVDTPPGRILAGLFPTAN